MEKCKNCTDTDNGCIISDDAYSYDEDTEKMTKLPGWYHYNPNADQNECMTEVCDQCGCDMPEPNQV